MKRIIIILILTVKCSLFTVYGQVIKYWPLYPTINDSITIIYDATKGTAQLAGQTNVYVHTGVITALSSSTSDWWNKKALWFDPDSIIKKNITKNLGNNKFLLGFNISKYYSVNSAENVRELCFVFRSLDGSLVGKNSDNSDIYIHVYTSGFCSRFIVPMQKPLHPAANSNVQFTVAANQKSLIKIYHQNTLVATSSPQDTVLNWSYIPTQAGKYWVKSVSKNSNGDISVDSLYYIVQSPPVVQNPPAGTKDGLNYIDSTGVILQLYAPKKSFVYLLGDFNDDAFDWQVRPEYQLNRTTDGNRYWIRLTNLVPRQQYTFQYYIDFDIKISDPYCELTLDGNNDPGIPTIIYPNLKKYPVGKTAEICGIIQTGQKPYQWKVTNFQRPDNRDIVAYELLIRDFSMRKSYRFVMDSLAYLKRLGINVIELMPVTQFEGNNSWGYMPEFNFAPAKIYGPKENLKMLIDAAHANGIAIVLDIVMNHNSGESPFAKLYFDKDKKRTNPSNPYFNVEIPHPFGQFYDFNHEAQVTKNLLDSVLSFWVNEYNVDGYRMDLSKGFTQTNTGSDVGAWGTYDQSRVNILERMANVFWKKHPGRWLILEHFANNDEEITLAGFGFMLWGNMNSNYSEAAEGWINGKDDFSSISYKMRQFPFHNLYGYMESHDEERVMYRNLTWGNSSGSYSIKNLSTALDRMALVNAFFIPVPGPKMMWQFGELGYDYSIYWPGANGNANTRTVTKPVKWTYEKDQKRYLLYKKIAALNKLKRIDPLFRTSNFETYVNHYDKRIRLWDDGFVGTSMACVIVGNFDVTAKPVWPEFTTAGTWYDYFTGNPLVISSSQTANQGFNLQLNPGEFRIYTSIKLPKPDLDTAGVVNVSEVNQANVYYSSVSPNPFYDKTVITYTLPSNVDVSIQVYNLIGVEVKTLLSQKMISGTYQVEWDGTDNAGNKVKDGYYIYSISSSKGVVRKKISFIK